MSVLITGAGGMLGWDLMRAFPDAVALGRAELDISNEAMLRKALSLRPKIVINSAAYTNVDQAETERELALSVNADAVTKLSRLCNETGAKLVHFSTDQVFDGRTQTPRTETDEPAPSNFYAHTKLLGERAALTTPGALVLRVQWLYGERKDRFSILKRSEVFKPFNDQFGAPTWTKHLSQVVKTLVDRNISGLFHFAYDDYASWADVYEFVKQEWRLPVRLEPRATETASLPAMRPRFSVLSNRKLCEALGVAGLGSWQDPLRAFLSERK